MRSILSIVSMFLLFCSGLSAQVKYTLKDCDLSFTSAEPFLAVYDNPGYGVFKTDNIQVTMSLIRTMGALDLEKELNSNLPASEYTVTLKGAPIQTSNAKALFYFADRKGYSAKFAKGIVLKGGKSILVDIKYEAAEFTRVKKLIESFFTVTTSQIPQGIAQADNPNTNTTTIQPANPTKEAEPTPEPEKAKAQKHLPVSHPNLIVLTAAQKKEFIDAHNKWRSEVGVPPLTWSDDLMNYAAEWAVKKGLEDCKMEHRRDHLYGENLYWSSGMVFSPSGAVDSWGSEINDYHGEVVGQEKAVVGHYTQIVWRTTTEVGCAAFQCGSALLLVCNYNPPGNWVGQHPY